MQVRYGNNKNHLQHYPEIQADFSVLFSILTQLSTLFSSYYQDDQIFSYLSPYYFLIYSFLTHFTMLRFLRSATLVIASLSHQHKLKLINQCYTNDAISERVNSLKHLPTDLSQLDIDISGLQFKLPPNINMTNAKGLLEYHKTHNTKINLNILHALAFIQFNAFQAYADTLLRFGYSKQAKPLRQRMNTEELSLFRQQIKAVALDEGQHCLLLIKRLKELGYEFGCFPVISNLNLTVNLTKQNILQRLALISIVHEGRGIKSIDRLIQKVMQCQDLQSSKILKKIQSEETYHFEVGLKWFKYFFIRQLQNTHQQLTQKDEKYELELTQLLLGINAKYRVKITLSDLRSGVEEKNPN